MDRNISNRDSTKIIAAIIIFIIIIGLGVAVYFVKKRPGNSTSSSVPSSPFDKQEPTASSPSSSNNLLELMPPIDRWSERVTKKPFGIKISPDNSPVQPERFSGYHTGVDFETFPEEQDIDVPIYAVCAGPLLLKEQASGYGGLAVQACKLANQGITVIYGHLRLSSIAANVGQQLSVTEKLAVLGTGYSSETDGERKHLHLGIHKGKAINILGYVQNSSELRNWIDIALYLK